MSNKHRLNYYDDREEDDSSNDENYEDYEADDGDDEHHHEDQQLHTTSFHQINNFNDSLSSFTHGNGNFNLQALLTQNKTLKNKENHLVKKANSFDHSIKKVRSDNDSNIEYINNSQRSHNLDYNRINHNNLNEVALFQNMKLSNNNNNNQDTIDLTDANNTNEPDENKTISNLTIPKYNSEVELDKDLINFTPGYKHISINELLKMHKPFRSSNILASFHHSKMVSNKKTDESYHIISSLLSDKIYQIHNEHNEKVSKLQERATRLIYQGVTKFDGHDSTIKKVWEGLLESIPQVVKSLIAFAREIPGLNELNPDDFNLIINNKIFDFFILRNAPLFINGESFMVLPNEIQYTRKWMNQVIGVEMTNNLFDFTNRFNKLGLTTKELALLYPLILTGKIYSNF